MPENGKFWLVIIRTISILKLPNCYLFSPHWPFMSVFMVTKKTIIAAILGVTLLATTALAQAELPVDPPLTAIEIANVDSASAYLNEIDTMQGDFLQINPDGSTTDGVFYMRRPGRIRFEYADPPLTLMSDGTWAMVNDRELESVDRYPLSETPLYLLLKKNIDLMNDANIVAVDHGNGMVAITASEQDGIAQGELTLIFAEPSLELLHWMITDVQGQSTVVMLKNVERDMKIDPALFLPDEGDIFGDDDFD